MLRVYDAVDQKFMDRFISNTMCNWEGWAFAQPDCSETIYPAQFVIVAEQKMNLATIQFLN